MHVAHRSGQAGVKQGGKGRTWTDRNTAWAGVQKEQLDLTSMPGQAAAIHSSGTNTPQHIHIALLAKHIGRRGGAGGRTFFPFEPLPRLPAVSRDVHWLTSTPVDHTYYNSQQTAHHMSKHGASAFGAKVSHDAHLSGVGVEESCVVLPPAVGLPRLRWTNTST